MESFLKLTGAIAPVAPALTPALLKLNYFFSSLQAAPPHATQHGHGAVQVQPAPPTMMAAASVASNMSQNNSYHYVTSSQANPQQQSAAAAGYANAAAAAAAAGTPQTIFYVSVLSYYSMYFCSC